MSRAVTVKSEIVVLWSGVLVYLWNLGCNIKGKEVVFLELYLLRAPPKKKEDV